MAVPKKKTTKAKRDQRRAHWKIKLPTVSVCPNCGEDVLPYHACGACGQYKGRQVLTPKEPTQAD